MCRYWKIWTNIVKLGFCEASSLQLLERPGQWLQVSPSPLCDAHCVPGEGRLKKEKKKKILMQALLHSTAQQTASVSFVWSLRETESAVIIKSLKEISHWPRDSPSELLFSSPRGVPHKQTAHYGTWINPWRWLCSLQQGMVPSWGRALPGAAWPFAVNEEKQLWH